MFLSQNIKIVEDVKYLSILGTLNYLQKILTYLIIEF